MGALFKALCEGVLMAVSDFSCNCFRILTSGLELCGLLGGFGWKPIKFGLESSHGQSVSFSITLRIFRWRLLCMDKAHFPGKTCQIQYPPTVHLTWPSSSSCKICTCHSPAWDNSRTGHTLLSGCFPLVDHGSGGYLPHFGGDPWSWRRSSSFLCLGEQDGSHLKLAVLFLQLLYWWQLEPLELTKSPMVDSSRLVLIVKTRFK